MFRIVIFLISLSIYAQNDSVKDTILPQNIKLSATTLTDNDPECRKFFRKKVKKTYLEFPKKFFEYKIKYVEGDSIYEKSFLGTCFVKENNFTAQFSSEISDRDKNNFYQIFRLNQVYIDEILFGKINKELRFFCHQDFVKIYIQREIVKEKLKINHADELSIWVKINKNNKISYLEVEMESHTEKYDTYVMKTYFDEVKNGISIKKVEVFGKKINGETATLNVVLEY